MGDTLLLFPAYGRRYQTAAEALADWQAGKDFSLTWQGGPYCSIRDLVQLQSFKSASEGIRLSYGKTGLMGVSVPLSAE